MTILFEKKAKSSTQSNNTATQLQQLNTKQELQQKIHTALQIAQNSPPDDCLNKIEASLLEIQRYCKAMQKAFIVVEEKITCDQYDLGGFKHDSATLFRSPNQEINVTICVTAKGSLLHRSDYPWTVYRNVGDVDPLEASSAASLSD